MNAKPPLDDQRIEFFGYEPLIDVLNAAAMQAAMGKGHERHAGDNTPFCDQPMAQITKRYGLGFCFGQVEKKMEEAMRMFNRKQYLAARAELLGAINYLAGATLHIEETDHKATK